jgi:hypothetical protein
MKICTPPLKNNLNFVTAPVVLVRAMKRLAFVTYEMDQEAKRIRANGLY